MPKKPMMILIAGPYRSGTDDDPARMAANLRKLEEAGYIAVEKSFVNRKPQTRLFLTAEGRKAWRAWLDRIDTLRSAAGD